MRSRASRPRSSARAALQPICLAAIALALVACGGSDTNSNATTVIKPIVTTYTIGGTITGLTVGSVVLANGTATVTVSANATTWAFANAFNPGTSYQVSVQTQPTEELCAVTGGGSGTDTGDVGNVTVVCGFGEWNWKGGSNTVNASAVYGTLGTAAAGNVPSARYGTSSWTDSSGNFWMFGGIGYDAMGTTGYLGDLWQYNPSSGLWAWKAGPDTINASGAYGAQGTASASNAPGARYSASSWIDSSGNLWLFGGIGYSSTGPVGNLNDLWRYTPSSGEWTWVSGAVGNNASGVYGTLATPSAGNVPGARYSASSWIDSSGNLWLFGGYGYDSTGAAGKLNDLWKYTPSSGEWTWISGGSGDNASGVYSTEGTASATNIPGARYAASSWIDSSGSLWLFGGYGYDSTGDVGQLNDLWQFTPSAGEWTWVNGEDAANTAGSYGTLGTAATTNLPGARQAASSWIDSSGNMWLFGGVGYVSTGGVGDLNDLWKYTPSNGEWTWISGGYVNNTAGVYGTQDTGSPGSVPGGRNSIASWIDSSGNLWLFGGNGYDSSGNAGYLNDLFQYTPSSGS